MELKDIILENKNLIYKLTHYFKHYGNKEDLFQAGCLGLIKAYKKYDDSFDTKFTTYAFPFILGEMRKYVREDKSIKISKDISKLNLQIEKATILLSQKLRREPTIDELSTFLEISSYDLALAINSVNAVCSFDDVIYSDGKDLTLYDVIKGEEQDIDSLIILRDELTKLPPLERKLINERYFKGLTQQEVATNLGMSQVQVSRNEQKVLTKLKQKIAS